MGKVTRSDTLIPLAARIPHEHRDMLDERALRAGCSRSEYVAALVRDHVNGANDDQIVNSLQEHREDLLALRSESHRLRNDLATVLELILLNVANISEQEVERVVSNVLRKRHREPEDA